MKLKLGLLAILFLLAGQAGAQNALTTPTNTDINFYGLFFDLSSTSDLRVTGLDVFLEHGEDTVEVWRVTDGSTWVGKGLDSALWTLVGTTTVYSSSGTTSPTKLPLPMNIALPAGSQMGFHITSQNGKIRYSFGTNLGAVESSSFGLSIHEGTGSYVPGFAPFTQVPGSNGNTRNFRGVVRFSNGLIGNDLSESTSAIADGAEDGVTFDVEAKGDDIIVNGLSASLVTGNHDLRLYVAESNASASAIPFNSSSWRLIGTRSGFSVAATGVVRLPFDFEAVVPKGTRRGFYLVSGTGLGLETQDASGGGITADGADLRIHSGETHDTAGNDFGALTGMGLFVGAVHYQVPNQMTGITAGGTGTLATGNIPVGIENGVFFDLKATEPLVVTGFSHSVVAGPNTVEVWAVTGGGSFQGKDANAAAWTMISTELVNAAVPGVVPVASGLRLFIPAGGIQGVYISGTNNALNALNVDQVFGPIVDIASDGKLSITSGTAGDYPFIPQLSGIRPVASVNYTLSGRADHGFFEDFSTASGLLPPTGWLNSFVDGNRPKLDGWRFDNPGNRTINAPQAGQIAIIDTDNSGTNNFVSGALYSPAFDASGQTQIGLGFDGYFRQFQADSQGWVEVWDGSVWNQVQTYNTTQTANPTSENYDITAAAGGSTNAMVRFRYEGNFAWYWQVDNVNLTIGQKGQRPQLGIGEFDINYSRSERHNKPVASGLPGPYRAVASVLGQTIFHWEGEPNQPIQLLAGNLNLANVALDPQGQLDIGSYDALTNTFPGILLVADGTANDIFNAAFRTSNAGECTIVSYLPPYLAGLTIHFQSVVYSSTQNIALTNVVSMTVLP